MTWPIRLRTVLGSLGVDVLGGNVRIGIVAFNKAGESRLVADTTLYVADVECGPFF